MKHQKVLVITSMLVFLMMTLPGCILVPVRGYDRGPGYGPPPHAPAHGYRRKHHGHDLVFDTDLGVYIVMGLPGLYFIDGLYYRVSSDGWHYSVRPDGDWHIHTKVLPGQLHKIPGGNKKRGNGNGKGNRGRGRQRDD